VSQCIICSHTKKEREEEMGKEGYTRRLRENEGVWQTWQDGGESHTRKGRGRTMGREGYVQRVG